MSGGISLWGGRFTGGPADALAALSVSTHFDFRLAACDLAGSRAHARQLVAVGILTPEEGEQMLAALTELGMTVPATFTVVSVGKDSPSAGKLKEGDVLTAITIDGTRHELKDGASLFSIMEKTPAKPRSRSISTGRVWRIR